MSEPDITTVRLIAADAIAAVCTICGQHSHDPCKPAGTMHLGRFSRAMDQSKITRGDFDLVLEWIGKTEFYTKQVPLG